jgi:putative ABC transport system permease protein
LMSVPDVDELRRRSRLFQDIGVARGQSVNLTGTDAPDRLTGVFVEASTLKLFGAPMAMGRTFTAEETVLGAGARVAVLSNAVWRSRFGGDANILGKTLILNGTPHTVIGVAAPGFDIPLGPTDVWLPVTSAPSPAWLARGNPNVWAFGRLKPGVTVQQGQQELAGIAAQLAAEYPATNAGNGASVIGLQDFVVGSVRPVLLVVLGAVGAVLLIACANVANLQLARASARGREMSVRAAMGASRSRLVRQLLTESVALAMIGGAAGIVLSHWAIKALSASVIGGLSLQVKTGLDSRVLAFSILITVLTGIAFGLAPALHAARADINSALRERGSGSAQRGGIDLRNVFVGVQLTLCIVLLVGAGLFTRTLIALQHANTGFRSDHLLTAEFRLPTVKYPAYEQQRAFMQDALAALRRVPGVQSVALGRSVPLSGNWGSMSYVAEGQPEPATGSAPTSQQNTVSDGFFRTMDIPLVQGRDFNTGDRAETLPVAIVNRRFADDNWPGQSPIGKHVRLLGPPTDINVTVVGVAGNVQQRFLNDPVTQQIYQPMSQSVGIFNSVLMRTTGEPDTYAKALRDAIWSVDRDQPVWKVRSMEALLGYQVASSRFTMTLTGSFALLALLLATVGVYGVMSFAVLQRTREVGIRMALGARKQQVVQLIVRRGIRVVAIALVAGTVVSVWAARLVEDQLFGVKAADPLTLIGVPVLLGSIALLACWIPARRAARVDPAITLRSE